MNKSKKRSMMIVLCCILIFVFSSNVFSESFIEPHITMEDILSSEIKTVYISKEMTFVPQGEIAPFAAGNFPITTRVTISQSSSNGTKLCDDAEGVFANIGNTVLSFIPGIPAMRVSQILSVLSLLPNETDYTQARTYKSYINYVKNGQAKWANGSYNTYIQSGKRNYYKHIYGAKKLSSGHWSTNAKDYNDAPAYVITGNYYNNSDSWFHSQANTLIQTENFVRDLPW